MFKIWDVLIVGKSSFPLFFAVAIIHQLREKVLTLDFNSCILLFSNMPIIDIQQCVDNAQSMMHCTPLSLTFLKYTQEKVNYLII